MTFNEAFDQVFAHMEDCDAGQLYYNMGISADYADDVQKLSIALVIIESGAVHVEPEVTGAIRKAAKNMLECGKVERESPEVRAETMDKMRHLI